MESNELEELRRLYPHLSEDELREVARNLQEYTEHAMRMYERLHADPEEYERFKRELKE